MQSLGLGLGFGWVVLAGASTASAVSITDPPRFFPVGLDLADLTDPPLTFVQTIADSRILELTSVVVGLRLVGVEEDAGFAGEMVVTLTRDLTDTSILLNRVGSSSLDPIGSPHDGWDVLFRDDATGGDVHLATLDEGVLDGVWQPDGRLVADVDDRAAMLGVFAGGPANAEWRLNVADLELGGQMRLESWSLTFAGLGAEIDPPPDPGPGSGTGGAVVPEPSMGCLGAVVFGGVMAAWRWRLRRNR